MWEDEIVEEVRRARDEYVARFNYDLDAIFNDIVQRQEQERLNGRVFVSLPPKRIEIIEESASEHSIADEVLAA